MNAGYAEAYIGWQILQDSDIARVAWPILQHKADFDYPHDSGRHQGIAEESVYLA